MIKFEIDGKTLEAESGTMIIQAADEAGVYIPRFCYHKKLSIAANCRMCLVDVEGARTAAPACATPLMDGMKIFTQSKRALEAQRAVMEFLLINHPLDCPICDQGGECELQDLSMGYGEGVSRFTEGKRSVEDEDLGPLISTEMTRCIHCTRCVRFGEEVAGVRELGATGRGEDMRIGTFVKHAVKSEVSGNIIDLCPVGALTNKPFRFTARAWELQQHESIAPHDCIGSNIYVHTRNYVYSQYRNTMRIVPRENESINETWISDRDRYAYQGLNSKERLGRPMIKRGSAWQEIDWADALHAAADKLESVKQQHGAEHLAALISPSASLEEQYLLQRLLRGLGSQNIDHRLHQCDFTSQSAASLMPTLGVSIPALASLDALLLIGSDVRREQPMASLRIRKASQNGAKIACINSVNYDFNFKVQHNRIVSQADVLDELASVLVALCESSPLPEALQPLLSQVNANEGHYQMAAMLKQGDKAAVVIGASGQNHPQAGLIAALAETIAEQSGASFGLLTEGANSAGAWLAGCVPHRGPAGASIEVPGYDAVSMFTDPRKAYVLVNVEPEHDCAHPAQALTALHDAECVVVLSPYMNQRIEAYADIVLPIAPYTEYSGTLLNCEGHAQTFQATSLPWEEARPAWKVLRVLGNLTGVPEFDYVARDEITTEVDALCKRAKFKRPARIWPSRFPEKTTALQRLGNWEMYCIDPVVRRGEALQHVVANEQATIVINPQLAERLQLQADELVEAQQQDASVVLPLRVDEAVADNTVLLTSGRIEVAGFGQAFGPITLKRSEA